MRKSAIVVGVVAGVLIVAGLIFWATFDINRYRGPIQAELQQRFGRPVTLGTMQLDLLPPRFRADKVIIGDDPNFQNLRPFIEADRIEISVKMLPLIHRSVQITSVSLSRPVVELIKNRHGDWNFSTFGPASTPQVKEPLQKRLFSLDSLSVNDGQVAITDQKAGQPRAVYDHIDVTLKDFAPEKQFSVQVAARLPGKSNQEVRVDGTGGPVNTSDLSATPFKGTVDLNGARLADLQQYLKNSTFAGLDGELTGTTNIDIKPGMGSIDGGFDVRKARVKKFDLGYTISTRYKLRDDFRNGLLTIDQATIKLGNTPLAVTGTVNTESTPAQLHLDVQGRNISLAEVSRLAAGFGVAVSPDATVKGRANANIQVRGTTDDPALSGTVSAGDVQVSGKGMAVPAQIKSVNFRLTPTDVRSDDFLINYDGTTLKSRVAVNRYTSQNPTLDANIETASAKLPAILAIAKAYGVTSLDNLKGEGSLGLKMRLSGTLHSLSGDSMLRGIDGVTVIDFNNLRISGTNLSQEISKVGGFLKPAGQGKAGFTDISKMTGHFTINNGVAQTDDLKAALDLGTIGVTGAADLASQRLDLHVNAVVAQKVSQQVGGTEIGGYMKTVLANGQGELVIPVLVTGTFQSPRVSPDLQVFAQMKLKGLIPTSNNPAGGLAAILGGVLGGKGGEQQGQQPKTQQQPQAQKPAPDPLQQMIDILSDVKKQPDQQQKPKPKQ